MEIIEVKEAMNEVLKYQVGLILVMVVFLFFNLRASLKKEDFPWFSLGMVIVLIVFIFTSFVPFLNDYLNNGIIESEGIYINNDNRLTDSTRMGMFQVTVQTESDTVILKTPPTAGKGFPQGQFRVKAYFTKKSEWLLHIDILGTE